MEQKRLRPITYAESLAAKAVAEEYETQIIKENPDLEDPSKVKDIIPEVQDMENSVSLMEVKSLPSGGKAYPENARVYFSPFTFGELKFLSASTTDDIETITFFLSKIHTNFDKKDLTYFDFYFLTVMIKISTFGDMNYNLNFVCPSCNHENKQEFSILDLEFEEVRVPLPIIVDLRFPITLSNGEEINKVTFSPMTIGNYMELMKKQKTDDYDYYMAYCIKEGNEEDKLRIIKDVLVGPDTALLESIDVNFYHGTKDIHAKCNNVITSPDGSEEVCGREIDIPFRELHQFIAPTVELERLLGERIHFGIQDGARD